MRRIIYLVWDREERRAVYTGGKLRCEQIACRANGDSEPMYSQGFAHLSIPYG